MSVQSADQRTEALAVADALFNMRLELFTLAFGGGAGSAGLELGEHAECLALSSSMRGKLCQQLANLPARQLREGDYLYHLGNPARSLFLLRSGLVKTSAVSPEGQELTLRIHKPGDILGELCLCGGGRRDEAIALEPSTVTEIPLATAMAQLRRDPEAALELASTICERLADAYEQVESFSWDTVLERLVRALLRLAADFGETSPAGTHITHYIRQEELAKLVGARREVVSGLLNRLRDSSHISYSPRGAITIDRGALQAFLDARARA